MYKEIFPIRLKARRTELDITQNDVSKDLGINQSNISKYEAGDLEPNLEKLGKLADYYHVSIDWLLGNQYHNEEGNVIKTALKEFKEEAIKTISGAIEQELNKEEALCAILEYLEEDFEKILKKYTIEK